MGGVFREDTKASELMILIENTGSMLAPEDDLQWNEAAEIIRNSKTRMELAENSFVYGCYKAMHSTGQRQVPVYDIPMMSDEQWNELVTKQKKARAAS